jgi:guanine deaminase
MNSKNTFKVKNAVILPGFYDLHFHWVQDSVRKMPKDSLLEWLEKYTFPAEARFQSRSYSKTRARIFFKRALRAGTIGGAVYSSIHACALEAAMKEARGNFIVGNVLMNENSPKGLTQTEAESIRLTRIFIRKYRKRFAFTPRFAITTTPGVMKTGATLSDRAGCFKQTHLSESPAEIEFVLGQYRKIEGFEKVKTYTEIYQKSGMLGPRSLMAHGIHLSRGELKILARTRTPIIHCPTSNAPLPELGLGSGLFDFRAADREKIRWALGSDIGGGPELSMLDVMRSFVDQNRRKGIRQATATRALYRATLAGASILGVDRTSGNLKKGKNADFIVIPFSGAKDYREPEELLLALIHSCKDDRSGYDRMVKRTYLNGNRV